MARVYAYVAGRLPPLMGALSRLRPPRAEAAYCECQMSQGPYWRSRKGDT